MDTAPFDALSGLVTHAERLGYTKADVAESMGAAPALLSSWLARRVRPSAVYRDAIALWSSGRLPAVAWRDAAEVAILVSVRPLPVADNDALTAAVMGAVRGHAFVEARDVLDAVGEARDVRGVRRVGAILAEHGYTCRQTMIRGVRRARWFAPQAEAAT